jgi:hypothetical protein
VKALLLLVGVVAAGAVFYRELPAMRRYLKIERM